MSLGNRGGSRPRKPTQLHILHGTYRKDRNHPDEPKPDIASIEPPEDLDNGLGKPGEAVKFWKTNAHLLISVRVLTQLDLAAFAMLANQWALIIKAQEELTKGIIFKSPDSGYPMLSPWWSILKRTQDAFSRGLIEFGMTPAARSRIRGSTEGPQKADERKGVHRFLA